MNSTKPSNNSLPDNLPLLTQVVETDAPDDLPTLTDVVADAANDLPDTAKDSADTKDTQPANLAAQENKVEAPIGKLGSETNAPEATVPPLRALGEEELQQILHYLQAHIDTILPEPAVPPPRALGEEELQQVLHYLEARIETILPEPAVPPPRALSEEELQQILHHLETHVEAMLTSKLSLHFEKLRDALNAHLDSKIQ